MDYRVCVRARSNVTGQFSTTNWQIRPNFMLVLVLITCTVILLTKKNKNLLHYVTFTYTKHTCELSKCDTRRVKAV